MKIINKIIPLFLIFLIFSCSESNLQVKEAVQEISKTQLVYDEIIKNGDFISSDEFPPIVNSTEVYQNLGKYLVVDVRKGLDYANGHIKGAVNIKLSELIDFAQFTGFPDYEKVIIVCYTGQSASYGAAVLRMLGYDNVFVMEWGMSSWNKKFSAKWEKNINDNFQSKLVKKLTAKKENTTLPEFEAKRNSGAEILYNRAKMLLKDGFGKAAVTVDRVVPNLAKSYEICLTPEDLYKESHLKGAVLYKADDLKIETSLLSIPNNKIIVVYDLNAHKSTFITAYLKMLGYDAKTLKYGANSFMNSVLKEKDLNGFSSKYINNYPTETSEYIEEEGGVEEGGC